MSDSTSNKVISAADYKDKFGVKFQDVVLPSTAVFKIRKLQVVDFLATIAIPLGWVTKEDLETWETKTTEDREKTLKDNKEKDPDSDIKFAKIVLTHGVVEPKIVQAGADAEKNELNIDELDPMDIAILSQEIAKLSGFDTEFKDRVRPFREE